MKRQKLLILACVLTLIIIGIASYIFVIKPNSNNVDQSHLNYPLVDNYSFYYNANNWKLETSASEIILTNKEKTTINLVSSKVEFSSLEDVLNNRLKSLNQEILNINQSDVTINGIKYKYLQIRDKDNENTDSEYIDAYAALLKNNIYFVGMVIYKKGADIGEFSNLISSIHEN